MKRWFVILFVSIVIFFVLGILSLMFGHQIFSLNTIMDSFKQLNMDSSDYYIIMELRVPRTILAMVVGASLGVSGLLIQNLTSNPMASPCIFGINAGASFFIVLGLLFFQNLSTNNILLLAFTGSTLSAIFIFTISNIYNQSPIKIALIGIVVTSLITALSTAIIISKGGNPQEVLKWTTGSFVDRASLSLNILLLIISCFLIVTLYASQMNIFSLGTDIAKSLGQNTFFWRVVFFGFIVIFSGFSVALAGAIGFIGLIIPHITKKFIGFDYRKSIPFSMLFGANFILLADLLSRSIRIQDLPIGLTMAFIGAPFLIYLASQKRYT
ncbi:MAG: FecCD family ABC transporter permease [Brevinema sp.]